MKVFGIAGRSGMGKTTLLERLVPELRARGLVVSLIKHSHKAIEIDRPGKDSYRLREAGCQEVLLLGDGRWALMHELRGDPEPPLDYLLSRLQHCDLVLVEGFKSGDFPSWRCGATAKANRRCGPTGRASWQRPGLRERPAQRRPCWSTSTAPTCPGLRPTVSVFDAGFALGDGVWEGLRLVNGRILSLSSHLDRLYEGARGRSTSTSA
jgi:molybdopterin-guanine dinucleotide biosynthesis protein MobB